MLYFYRLSVASKNVLDSKLMLNKITMSHYQLINYKVRNVKIPCWYHYLSLKIPMRNDLKFGTFFVQHPI